MKEIINKLSQLDEFKIVLIILVLIIFIVELVAALTRRELFFKTIIEKSSLFLVEHIFGITDKQEAFPEKAVVDHNIVEYLSFLIKDSRDLANTVFKRGISYFIFALMVSVLGIILFFLRTGKAVENFDDKIYKFIFSVFDRFGMPIFVETVAFYLFRQFRITMDDFKYYNRITAIRESYLVIVKLFKSDVPKQDRDKIVKVLDLYNDPDVLKGDQKLRSSDIRSVTNDELNFLKSLLDRFGIDKAQKK